jgi:tRNA pseudouridine38-40 synthase
MLEPGGSTPRETAPQRALRAFAGAPMSAVAAGDGGLTRLRLDLAYDGTAFSGWARQPGQRTVAGVVEAALCTVLRLDTAPLTVAGRTDAGVHARGQVAHVDVPGQAWTAVRESLARRLAGVLPEDVVVHAVAESPAGFDARFGALWRRYRYRVADDLSARDPLRRVDTLWWPRPLDVEAIAEAAAGLVGEHDFVAFCRRREGAGTVRTLHEVEVLRDDVVTFTLRADAFCHSMVRSVVGALIAVGEGRRDASWLAGLLAADARVDEIGVMPPHGLTLLEVGYPPDDQLADRVQVTRAKRHPVTLPE